MSGEKAMADSFNHQVEILLSTMFTAADQRGPTAAAAFARCFAEDGKFFAGAQALNGQRGMTSRAGLDVGSFKPGVTSSMYRADAS